MEEKTKSNNRLWQARHRLGLEQKQVARLLGHKTTDQISRYERGTRLPSFKTACKLAIVYGATLQELFPEHHRKFSREINEITEAYAATFRTLNSFSIDEKSGQQNFADSSLKESSLDAPICHYAGLLDKPVIDKTELDAVRRHTTKLARTIAHL